MKVNFKSLILLILAIIVVISAVSMFQQAQADKTDFTFGNFTQLLEEDAVVECIIDEDLVAHIKAYEVETDKDGKLVVNEKGEFVYKGYGDEKTLKEYTCPLMYTFQVDKIDDLVDILEILIVVFPDRDDTGVFDL